MVEHNQHRLRKWIVTNPEKAGSLALGLGALTTAVVSAIVAILSLYVALQALNHQTASDQANRDVQIQSFASKVSLVGESDNGGAPPTALILEDLNNAPLAVSALIIGANANVQFSSDGSAYITAISWRNAYKIDGLAPCSQYTLNISADSDNARNYSGLIFSDDNNLTWYREGDGLLVQVLLQPAQQSNLLAKLAHVPLFLSTDYSYKTFTGCS